VTVTTVPDFPGGSGLQPHASPLQEEHPRRVRTERGPDREQARLSYVATIMVSVLAGWLLCGCTPDESEPTPDAVSSNAPSASPEPTSAASPAEPMPDQKTMRIDPRPIAGAAAADGSSLLVYDVFVRAKRGPRSVSAVYRLHGADGRLRRHELLAPRVTSADYGISATSVEHGFLVSVANGRTWLVTRKGVQGTVPLATEPVDLRADDVYAPRGHRPWFYRPSTATMVRARLPRGFSIDQFDGQGRLWHRGQPENGQEVMWSALPGEQWSKQYIGAHSPPGPEDMCTCQFGYGPHGSGSVIVVGGFPTPHVSLDFGRSWTTVDLGASEPYRATIRNLRLPLFSALPDGRMVVGYMGWWVARDPSNTSFAKVPYTCPLLRQAGLDATPAVRDGLASPDAGWTWVPLPKRNEIVEADEGP
jgi:hypothetical protein